ncbi:MAG: hypothetical protein ACK5M3_13235 [Dysgonomonas sp.]
MDSTFNAYVDKLDDEFIDYTKKMDEDFYKYLEQEWTEFSILEGRTRTQQFSDLRITNASLITSKSYPSYPKSQNKSYSTITLKFFEHQLSVRIDPLMITKLKSLSETEISRGWKSLSECNFAITVSDISSLKKQFNLNDWAVYCLVDQLSNEILSGNSKSDKSLLTCFILTHAGYDVKLGRTGINTNLDKNRLILLAPFTSEVFNQNRIDIQNKTYYIEPLEKGVTIKKGGKIYSYQKNFSLAKNNVNLYIKSLPRFGSTIIQRKINSPYSDMNSSMRCVKGLVDFYNTYPDTELAVYLNTPFSFELKKSLNSALQSLLISRQSNTAKIEKLLKWFYHTFSYREDTIEKALFAEQSPLHRYTDCEDRAIFFARIAKEILNLDVVLFEFNKHVAPAICLDNKKTDYCKEFGGKKYIICDPSSKECKVGYIMEQLDKNKAFVIPLIQ